MTEKKNIFNNFFDLNLMGDQMYELMEELFPITRSITGEGVRKSLKIFQNLINLKIHEIPTKIKSELINFYSKRFSIKRPTKQKNGRISYNEILAKFRNPLTIEEELFKPEKMKIDKIHFYHYHAMPPNFQNKYPELFIKLSKKLEKSDSWKGYFLSSAFVVESSKI
jgi:hypothetical protein